MKFNTYRTRIGDDEIRHRNVLESDMCDKEGFDSVRQQQDLLQSLAATKTFQMCGTHPFQKMKMEWNSSWRIELEATYKGKM